MEVTGWEGGDLAFYNGWSKRPHGKVTLKSRHEGMERFGLSERGFLRGRNRKPKDVTLLACLRKSEKASVARVKGQGGMADEAGEESGPGARDQVSDLGRRA